MNKEETDNIERYLQAEMSVQEQLDFETRLSQDPDLQRETEIHRDLLLGMEYHYSADLKKKLQIQETPVSATEPPSQSRKLFLTYTGIAAAFILLIGAGYLYVSSSIPPQDLYMAYYQPYPNIINPIERSGTLPDDPLERALIAYDQGNFNEAIQLFQENDEAMNAGHKFYLALSYLETGNQATAVEELQEVLASEDETFYLPALWYQGLAYLSAQQAEEAREVFLKLLEEEDSTYYPKAQEILSEL